MRVLVTGANGQLGMSLRKILPDALFTDVEELDITDLEAVRALVKAGGIDTLINCAGYTNVEAAEDNEALAHLLNAGAVENLAVAMKEVGGLLVHISTDYVYGGEPCNTPITEAQKPCPQGVYAVTKWRGEEAIARVGCRHIILRTAWLYSEYGKNFVKTMLRLTAEKPSLKVVFDQVGTPTYAGDLADAIVHILQQVAVSPEGVSALFIAPGGDASAGIYHYTNEGVCSWYDFAKTIAEYAGHTACDIQPCHSNEFPSKVKRPAYSVLDKTLVKQTFGLRIPHWTESLKKCLKNL